jgi:hypothetical protein
VFSFRLNQSAAVRLTFLLAAPGRRRGRRCVAPGARNHRKHACTRWLSAGILNFTGHAGLNRVVFHGHLGRRSLKPGRYMLQVSARNRAGQRATPRSLRFTILGR